MTLKTLIGTSFAVLALALTACDSGSNDVVDYQPGNAILGDFGIATEHIDSCLLYTSPSPRDATLSRMPSSA